MRIMGKAEKAHSVQTGMEGETTIISRIVTGNDQVFIVLIGPDRIMLGIEANGKRLAFPIDPKKVNIYRLSGVRSLIGVDGEDDWKEEDISSKINFSE
jgi:hypothetical protein